MSYTIEEYQPVVAPVLQVFIKTHAHTCTHTHHAHTHTPRTHTHTQHSLPPLLVPNEGHLLSDVREYDLLPGRTFLDALRDHAVDPLGDAGSQAGVMLWPARSL